MSKMKRKQLETLTWNVFVNDFNKQEIVAFDVFHHHSFAEEVAKLKAEIVDRDSFSERLKRITMYYFWSKCEYETVITSWPPYIDKDELRRLNSEDDHVRYTARLAVGKKVDVYQQLYLNWDRFVDYVFNH